MMRPDANRATWIGFSAILLWATLAWMTTLSGPIPPFQLTAMTFALAFICALVGWRVQGVQLRRVLRLPLGAWLLGVGGLFGYHFFYFVALQHAPAAQASLIAYLWPLLIVLFSALLPGERLRAYHLVGGLCGFLGAALLVGDGRLQLESRYLAGFAAALACALIWSGYSVLSRRYGQVPTAAVGAFCGVTAALAGLCHLAWETTVWPQGHQWWGILGLGLGPVGIAFFTWDYGVKHGHLRLLGVLSYLAPLLSTLLLIAAGQAEPSLSLLLASGLIVGGALLASLDRLRPRPVRD